MYATELAAKTLEPTSTEERLADDYAALLATLSRVDQALREGVWHDVRDELDELISVAEDMWSTLSGADHDEDSDRARPYTAPAADAAKVRQLVAVYARPHPAGRALYPAAVIEDPQLRAAVESETEAEREEQSGRLEPAACAAG
ncbi:hypothetical protein GCM10010218_53580 [Streptomyces mashuensis]|uniref:Uncharacterized protein n=1 Tax=Streptomyces mashuensis TaxID=33904 RepID=A0A919B8W8_9ACTN|nr:hypothetical protein [Streptomyces mashuensis]GHF65382.1 hypothetical protein GCM10010218_53580 [Streptomyces mashuensis]